MSETRLVRARAAAVLSVVLLSGVLLAAVGCGGDKDKDQAEGLPARDLVPGAVQLGDTAATDPAALAAPYAAEPAAAPAAEALVPPPATGPRREPPRTADQARLAVPGGTYSLQLGSFLSLDNARSLGARVEALGYAPVLESAVVGGQTYHRVLLRGLADRTEASRTGERLRSELGVTYLIRQGD